MSQELKLFTLKVIRVWMILFIAASIIIPSGWFINKFATEQIVLNDCVMQVSDLVVPEAVSDNEIKTNCETVKTRVDNLLKEFGNKNVFPVYITEANKTACGDGTLGCVLSYNLNGTKVQYMTISITSDYYTGGLRQTVAHEYVHTLTSIKEAEWLENHKELFPVDSDPLEIAADCGIEQIAGEFSGGAYIEECTPELNAISTKIINDTLV